MSAEIRGLWKCTYGEISQTLKVLEDLNIMPDDLKRLRRNKKFAARLAKFWKDGGNPIPDNPCQAKAREIMGENFLGLEEVRTGYDADLDPAQFAKIPFREETLLKCKDTHVLVAGAALSLNDIRKSAHSAFSKHYWCRDKAFAKDRKVNERWYLLRKEPVPESIDEIYSDQIALLTGKEEVPFACEMTYMIILYWLTHGETLFEGPFVRCQDEEVNEHGDCVSVGNFDLNPREPEGFGVGMDFRHEKDFRTGLASAVRPEKA